MGTISLKPSEFLLIELALCRAVARAEGRLAELRGMGATEDAENAGELEWLTSWAELSVTQHRCALNSLRVFRTNPPG